MLHVILLLRTQPMLVKHFVGAVRVRDYQIDNFFILATPTVNDSGVVVILILDGLLHCRQCELLSLVVAISAHLHSHRTNKAGIDYL